MYIYTCYVYIAIAIHTIRKSYVVCCLRLSWELEGFQTELSHAVENLQTMIKDNDITTVAAPYGKRVPKQFGLSPDGWFQVSTG